MNRIAGLLLLIVASSLCLAPEANARTKTTSSWSAADLAATKYRKYLVLARISEESARRVLEDAMVRQLQKAGVEALAAYQVLSPADLADDDALTAKADELGVDAGIVFTVQGQGTKVEGGSRVHASVGVPVHSGRFSAFLGTSVPLGRKPSTVKTVEVKAELHAREGDNPRWIGTFSTDLKKGTDDAAKGVADQATKALRKAGAI